MPENRSEPELPNGSGEWFVILLAALCIFFSLTLLNPINDESVPLFPQTANSEDSAKIEAMLARHLSRPGVREALKNMPVTVVISNNYFLVPNAQIALGSDETYYEISFSAYFISQLSDGQISAVMGHELGHAIMGHVGRSYGAGRENRLPRFEEIHSDCFGIYFAGRDDFQGMLRVTFGKDNPYIDAYLVRLQKICDEDHVYDRIQESSKTP